MELYRINPSAAHVKELLLGVGGWVGGSACGSGQLAGFEVGGARARFQVVKTGHSSIAA